MLLRCALFVLMATAIRCADVCEALPSAPSAEAHRLEWGSRSYVYRLTVNPKVAPFRITIRPIRVLKDSQTDFVHTADIEVASCRDGKRLQLLPVTSWETPNFASTFHAEDVNFDGYLDFAMVAEFGALFHKDWWWVYDPDSAKFVNNDLTRVLSALSANEIVIDSQNKQIIARQVSASCGRTQDRYRVIDDTLVFQHQEVADFRPGGCSVGVWDRVDGVMQMTTVRKPVGAESDSPRSPPIQHE